MAIVNLSVHKNNMEQKRRKRHRKLMIEAAKGMSQSDCVEGFYFVSWNKDGYQDRLYDPKAVIGKSSLSSYVGGCAQRMVNRCDQEDS